MNMLTAVLLVIAVLGGGIGLLAVLFRWQVRRFDRTAATDLLDDWQAQLELLDGEERRSAALAPPANVLAAMAALPGSGLRNGWDKGPVTSLHR